MAKVPRGARAHSSFRSSVMRAASVTPDTSPSPYLPTHSARESISIGPSQGAVWYSYVWYSYHFRAGDALLSEHTPLRFRDYQKTRPL